MKVGENRVMGRLWGLLLATGFIFVVLAGQIILTRNTPPSWTESLHPPFNVVIFLIPIALLTFLVARRISIHAGFFGLVAFVISFVTLAFVFGFRGIDDSLDVPVIFAIVYAVTFLSGFVGRGVWQRAVNYQRKS